MSTVGTPALLERFCFRCDEAPVSISKSGVKATKARIMRSHLANPDEKKTALASHHKTFKSPSHNGLITLLLQLMCLNCSLTMVKYSKAVHFLLQHKCGLITFENGKERMGTCQHSCCLSFTAYWWQGAESLAAILVNSNLADEEWKGFYEIYRKDFLKIHEKTKQEQRAWRKPKQGPYKN